MTIVKPGEVAISEAEPQHSVRAGGQRASGRNDRFRIFLDYLQTVNVYQFMTAAADFRPNIVSGIFCNADDEMSRATELAVDSLKFAAIVAIQIVVDSTPDPAEAVFENGEKAGLSWVGSNSVDMAVLQYIQATGTEPHCVIAPSGNRIDDRRRISPLSSRRS